MNILAKQSKPLSPQNALHSFISAISTKLHNRNSYYFTALLQLPTNPPLLKTLHAQIITSGLHQNPFLASKLVANYLNQPHNPSIHIARNVFDSLTQRDTFVWNVVIQGYANVGPFDEAITMCNAMRAEGMHPNAYTYPFVLKACGAMRDGKCGRVVHGMIVKAGFEGNVFVGNAVVAMYAKCGEVEVARRVFEEMPRKDVVSWNSMVSGYVVSGYVEKGVEVFCMMLDEACAPGHDTLVCVLPACVDGSAVEVGLWIHCYVVKYGVEVGSALGTGLVTMYTNCGRVRAARVVFDLVGDKNVVLWSAMMRCYGMHGQTEEVLRLFSQFEQSGLQPDAVVLLCLLSACSHAGMVAKGLEFFNKMEEYGVEKNEKHYGCIVDLLGRAGLLDRAVKFIESMPIQPGKDVYGALLGACRIHNNIELAEETAEKLFVLDPGNAGRYILMANMYENAGRWEDAARVRRLISKNNIKKPTGRSSIEVECRYHTFGADDESHPYTEEIFDTLERLDRIMEEAIVIMV